MPAIKAINSKNITITNSTFTGFETDIELENVKDFVSENNQFSNHNPLESLKLFQRAVSESRLDEEQKQQLFNESLQILATGKSNSNFNSEVEIKKSYISSMIGSKAADYFVQVAAAITAGLILINK